MTLARHPVHRALTRPQMFAGVTYSFDQSVWFDRAMGAVRRWERTIGAQLDQRVVLELTGSRSPIVNGGPKVITSRSTRAAACPKTTRWRAICVSPCR